MASTFQEHKTLSGRILSYSVLAPLLLTGFFFLMEHFGLLERLENLTLDQRIVQRAKNQAPPDSRIFFVAIDDTTLGQTGWPIDRIVYAQFMEILSQVKPALFCFDIIFDRPSQKPDSDHSFALAAQDCGIPVYTGVALSVKDPAYAVPNDFKTGWTAPPEIAANKLLNRSFMFLPIPELRENSKPALVEVPKDAAGITRQAPMYACANGQIIPTLALACLMEYWKLKPDNIRIIPGDAIYIESQIIKRRIPIDSNGNYHINFRYDIIGQKSNPYYNMPTFAAAPLYNLASGYQAKLTNSQDIPNLPDVSGKILLIGTTAVSATDLGPSPFQAESPRPIVHLNIIDNILKEDYLRPVPPWSVWLGLLLLGYLSLWGFSKTNFWISALTPLLLVVGYIWLCFILFSSGNIVLPLVGPSLAFLFLHIGSVAKQVLVERAAREHLRRTFSTYVSPAILETIYRNPESLQLGGASKDVTILFTDLRNFTTMTESMDSATLVKQLNEYFTEMVACITRHNGTLHKYIGDAIMAVWGDVTNEGAVIEAGQALRAAIEMREAMSTLNQRWRSEGRPEFHMGIGINHGHVIVGNIGAPQRMEFTVIGDAVNLASRLEGVNKQFGTDILIGQSVHELTHERFLFRSLAKIQVVGKSIPVEIYEPMCEIGSEQHSPYSQEWLQLYQEAQQRFQERRYDVAARLFEACLHEYPENKICVILLNLCHQFAANPPPEDWDGALELSSK